MLLYPSGIDLSSPTLRYLSELLTARRRERGTRWRCLTADRQALLVLAHLHCKHKWHGMNVQVVADAFGRLLWASPVLPGAVHGIKAVRTHGIIEAPTKLVFRTWADKGYLGARGTILVPCRDRWSTLPTGKRAGCTPPAPGSELPASRPMPP